uniref:importin-5 n=1 Tax=Ciona intestinalis TaxID=7719 RepID=UPI000180B641|nr:importin-5 [Ciona intestinalis]|eukprot:XP_026689827.1 importin-5 [Ciona intestinalis]
MTVGKFREILTGINSSNNDTRNAAEKEYEEVPLVNRFMLLVEILSTQEQCLQTSTLAAILLRRIITSSYNESFGQMDADMQPKLRAQVIDCIKQETNSVLRRKKADCLSELARKSIDANGNNHWPEVLTFMFGCVNSTDPGMKEIPLHVFSQFPGIFGNQQDHYQNVIRQMLGQCMMASEQPSIRFLAAQATMAFLLTNTASNQLLRHFQELMPAVIQAAEDSASEDKDVVLKSLVELCEDAPKVVRPFVEPLLTTCLKVLGNAELENSIRQLALEAIVTLSETAPGLIRKQKAIIPIIIPQMLALMIDLDEDEDALAEWSVADDAEDEEGDANTVAGENAIDRFACALGGKTILPHIMSTVPPMLQNEDWRYRHGGLMAISAVGEGCHKYMEEILEQIVNAVLPYLNDAHPRVRYAACNATGQMCTDFAPTIQKQCHARIVPSLCNVLDDVANPRVQAHAGAALVNFVEDCPKSILLLYLNPLCMKLEQVLSTQIQELVQKGTKLVLEQITTTIAAVADTAEEKFILFYDRFMPSLKYIMANAKSNELRMLRGKTIECISLIGLAVGSEKFMPDAEEIMQQLLATQENIESWQDDDPQISYMISAWTRICKLLGQKFVQYLPVVMGPLMKAASIKPEVTMLDSQDAEDLDENDGWEFIKLGGQQSFGIKTAGLEEKSTACEMLVCYARELKEGFVDYVEDVVKLMVPLLKFYFHDGVRSSASEALPYLLECAALRGEEYVDRIWTYIAPHLLSAVKDEPDKDVLTSSMESLAKCIELRGRGSFSMEQYQELTQIIQTMLNQHFDRAAERQMKRADEDYDEQIEETLQDEDQEDVYILSKVADILHSLFGVLRAEVLPLFDVLLPHYAKLLESDRPWADRQWSLCVFDDVIEYASPESIKYQDVFVRPLITYIEDESPEVRQAAAYGVGVMASCASETYYAAITESIPRLKRVIEGPHGRGVQNQPLAHENLAPLENCISAVGKILRHCPAILGSEAAVAQLLQLWLSWLPVTEDKEEAAHVYRFVCDLIESNNQVVLGENNSNLPAVISLIADAVYGEAFEECADVAERLIVVCKQIQMSATECWNNSLSQLDIPKLQSLNNFLSSHAS